MGIVEGGGEDSTMMYVVCIVGRVGYVADVFELLLSICLCFTFFPKHMYYSKQTKSAHACVHIALSINYHSHGNNTSSDVLGYKTNT